VTTINCDMGEAFGLYRMGGMAARSDAVAHAICDAADVFKTPLMGMIGTQHEIVYRSRGHAFIAPNIMPTSAMTTTAV
jgi:hypothetical protein